MDHSGDRDAGELAGRVGRLVRGAREQVGLTAADLAERSGLSRTIVSRIERGEGNPSLETLWRLSRALRIPVGELIDEASAPRTRVIRAGEGQAVTDASGMVARLLHGDGRERRAELFSITLPAGARRESIPHFRGVDEVLVVLEGILEAGPPGDAAVLGAGDALWFAADAPHHYRSVGEAPCRFLCWMLYPAGTP